MSCPYCGSESIRPARLLRGHHVCRDCDGCFAESVEATQDPLGLGDRTYLEGVADLEAGVEGLRRLSGEDAS